MHIMFSIRYDGKSPLSHSPRVSRELPGVVTVMRSGSIAVQFDVQVDELSDEAPVGDDPSPLFNRVDGLHQGHVVLQHQIRQDDGGRAAHAHVAVHQDFTCRGETSVHDTLT